MLNYYGAAHTEIAHTKSSQLFASSREKDDKHFLFHAESPPSPRVAFVFQNEFLTF